MIDRIFALSNSIRYVAIYDGDQLETKSKSGTIGASGQVRVERVSSLVM